MIALVFQIIWANKWKIVDMHWLAPSGLQNEKTSQTDMKKRHEIFYEFLYYVVDSMLIPLIRNNFYVTESNTHRYRIFYFRHDIWRHIAEPAMAALKSSMFEEVKLKDALRILDSRMLGFSQIRLLPKESTLRPIMNLRRRAVAKRGRKLLGPSINTILGPVYTMLNLEKVRIIRGWLLFSDVLIRSRSQIQIAWVPPCSRSATYTNASKVSNRS